MLAYSGKGRFVVQKLDLGQLVETTTQMLQLSISKKAVLRFQLARQLPAIEADATQIRQVIMNLVINASEAIGEDSGVIGISTGVTRVDRAYLAGMASPSEIPEGDFVYLEVSDTGCGMTPETQARIFEPFFTTKFTGRGLGLAAVLGIMRGHRGALKVYSEFGHGTTFKVLFPAVSGPLDPVPETPGSTTGRVGQGTVLVVDDEATIRTTVVRMLSHFGFEAVSASDGREALQVFRANPGRFDVVLLDLTMPYLDGEQTFAELRRLRPDMRVVLMSGFSQQEALLRFTGKGLANFLQKPFGFEALREVLQTASP
jgi:CheY-like chemotaxis protein